MLRVSQHKRLAGLGYIGGVGSSVAIILVLGLMLFAPGVLGFGAMATEEDPNASFAARSGAESDITTLANTSVGISVPTSIDFSDVLPTVAGVTTTAAANIGVTTTDSAGYSVFLYSADGNNSLKSINPTTTSSITATNTSSTISSLANNTWGYSIGTTTAGSDTLYAAVPTDGSTPIQTKDTSTTNSANDTYTLSFAAKVNTDLPSGTYSNTLTLAVVAEPKAITDITGLTYMQEMTPEVCEETEIGTTATLTDKRDNNTYTIAKLPDNNCWMTQNLRLSSGRTLTPEDSNVTSNWEFPTGSLTSSSSYTEARSTVSSNTSYGGYYNYCAASAGSACSYYVAQDATQDICPKGWRLPTLNEFEGITSYASAFSPVYSGNYSGITLDSAGSYGSWWSATAGYGDHKHYLYYISGSLDTSNYPSDYGRSVRCIRAD